ncbi:hypothetical protein CYR52_19460 [Chimaeribacter arupi]|nr:hypothetical protein CYR52_19460 [Chimaeribacter arupi]
MLGLRMKVFMYAHRIINNRLVLFEGGSYLDIAFCWNRNPRQERQFRLIFCSPSLDPVAAESMHHMLGTDLYTQSVRVVSFYDHKQEKQNPHNLFKRPEDAPALSLRELHYLYSTLIDIMFTIAKNERIHLLYFVGENEQLNAIYTRYLRKFSERHNLICFIKGASYAIWTPGSPA